MGLPPPITFAAVLHGPWERVSSLNILPAPIRLESEMSTLAGIRVGPEWHQLELEVLESELAQNGYLCSQN